MAYVFSNHLQSLTKHLGLDGDEVVVIGVTTPETATKTHPRNIPGVSFTDPITEV